MKRERFLMVGGLVLVLVASSAARGTNGALAETQSNSVATNLGLYGATTWDVEKDPSSSYIYLATKSPNGFFSSSDGGASWRGLPAGVDYGGGQDVEVNPANGDVFALLGSLLLSTDHGAAFNEIGADSLQGTNGSSLLFADGKLFVGTENGNVNVSSDEGKSFSPITVNAGTPVVSLANGPGAVYALSKNRYSSDPPKLFRSVDGGASWSDLNVVASGVSGAEKVVVNPNNSYVFLIPGSEGGTTYRSPDGGASWTPLAGTTPATGYMSFDSSGRTYVGWNYSVDNGDSWTSFGPGGSYGHYLLPDPGNDNILYDTSMPGFSISKDRGLSWTDSVKGITGVVATSVAQATDKNNVWVATQNGLAKSTNFTSSSPNWTYPIEPTANFVSAGKDSVWVDPGNSQLVVLGTSASIWRSADGGSSWTQATADIPFDGTVARQIVSSSDGATIYAAIGRSAGQGTAGGVIKSTDGGATWTSMGFPDGAATQSIAVASDGDIFAGAGSSTGTVKGLYKYSGGAWTHLNSPDYDVAAVLADPEAADTIYVLAAKTPSDSGVGFYKSTDDGQSFRQITSGLDNAYEYTALAIQRSTTPNSLYLSALNDMQGVIYKSSDGGETWVPFYKGLKNETFYALLFDGLVAGNDRGLYSIKSRVSLRLKATPRTVNKGRTTKLAITMKDAATKKALKKRAVNIYRRVGKRWKRVKKATTGRKGRTKVTIKLSRTSQFQARWKPKKKTDKAEFASAKSKRTRVKVRA